MATYKFEWLNNNVEIVNPTITIDSKLAEVDTVNLTVKVNLTLENETVKVGLITDEIQVDSLNYDGATLHAKVLEYLQQFEI